MKKKFVIRAAAVFVMLVAFRAATTSIAPLINNLLDEQGYPFARQAMVSGIVLAIGYIASVFGSLFGGWVADKMGSVRTCLFAGGLFAAAFMLWSVANSGVMLYFNRAILSLCTGALYVALQSYLLGGVKKGSEGMAMGVYGLSFGVGTALAGTAAGLADGIGITRVFFVLGVICVGAVVLGFAATRVDAHLPYPQGVEPAKKDSGESVSFLHILKSSKGAFWVLLLNAAIYGFGLLVFLQYTDEFGSAKGIAGTQASFGIAVFSIISLAQPLTGLVADKIGKGNCAALGQGLIALGWCLLALLPGITMATVLLCSAIAGIGSALYSPAVLAIAEISAPVGAGGTVRGVYQGASSFGSAIAAIAGAVIYQKIGIINVFLLLAVSCLLGFATVLLLVRLSRKADHLA